MASGETRGALPVPGMARTRKRLGDRVRRILEGPAEAPSARRRWLPAAAAALLLAGAALVPGLAPSSFAVPQADEPQGSAPEGEPPAGDGPEGEGPEDDFDLPDPAEISELVAEAMEAQREALEELAELRLDERLSPEEHVELEAELRAAHEELERANEEVRRANDEIRRANEEIRRANEEIRRELEIERREMERERERLRRELREETDEPPLR